MLLRPAQLHCRNALRNPLKRRITIPGFSLRGKLQHDVQYRSFTAVGGLWNKQNTGQPQIDKQKQTGASASAPETPSVVNSKKDGEGNNAADTTKLVAKKPDPLSGNSVTSKQQRKVDWAIMKEMAKYLWPKVRIYSLSRSF